MSSSSIPYDMACVEISEPGGPNVLKPGRRPVPRPTDNQVLIRVGAAGVNRPDVLQRQGLYPPPEGASDLPGLEVAGEVAAIGDRVSGWKIGDAVCALLTGGGYAEYAIADAGSCLPVPAGLSVEEAAGLPETIFTVWANVFDDAKLEAGETFMVHGGTSGIGVTAITMAKAMGAKVFATASSEEKLAAITDLRADMALNYQNDDWEREINEAGGVDVLLDMTGGDFFARNLACMKPGGRHVSIAFLRGAEAKFNVFTIMQKRLKISGSTMKARDFEEKSRLARQIQAHIWPLLENKTMTPVMDEEFSLANAAKAHTRMEAGEHIGKIILKIEG